MANEKFGYSEVDIELMQNARDATSPGENRITELRKWAHAGGVKKIGIAHCAALSREAARLQELLSDGFEVMLAGCKLGKIPQGELLGDATGGVSCNPVGQAQQLKEWGSELNIVVGLCVGHDMLFQKYSHVPSTTLIVKDRKHRHNPVLGLQE